MADTNPVVPPDNGPGRPPITGGGSGSGSGSSSPPPITGPGGGGSSSSPLPPITGGGSSPAPPITGPAPQAPHDRAHGSDIFNHPSTNRATASLTPWTQGKSSGSGVAGALHKEQKSNYQAEANADFAKGNQKAYHKVRVQAAKQGVKLAAYSTRQEAKNNKGNRRPVS